MGVLVSVFLYSKEKNECYESYGRPLPLGIDFNFSKRKVLASLGVPAKRGGGKSRNFGVFLTGLSMNLIIIKCILNFHRNQTGFKWLRL